MQKPKSFRPWQPDQPLRPASYALTQANRQEIDADLAAECDRRNPPPSTSLNP